MFGTMSILYVHMQAFASRTKGAQETRREPKAFLAMFSCTPTQHRTAHVMMITQSNELAAIVNIKMCAQTLS